MKNDFKSAVDHRFQLRADWGAVDCLVLAIEPNKMLSYTWGAMGLESVVTWTLTPTQTGTLLRMEQSGFRRISSRRSRAPNTAGRNFSQASNA